jgi:hypothetical protein
MRVRSMCERSRVVGVYMNQASSIYESTAPCPSDMTQSLFRSRWLPWEVGGASARQDELRPRWGPRRLRGAENSSRATIYRTRSSSQSTSMSNTCYTEVYHQSGTWRPCVCGSRRKPEPKEGCPAERGPSTCLAYSGKCSTNNFECIYLVASQNVD